MEKHTSKVVPSISPPAFRIFLDKQWMLHSHYLFSPTIYFSAVPLYLIIIRLLRYRTRSKQYVDPSLRPNMSITQARDILEVISAKEFPFTFKKALEFALFRTYGIPTISTLLAHTTEFSNPATSGKRLSDTSLLVTVMIGREWGSEDWVKGISRINCVHDKYQKAGKISNDDLLYTLSLFALEPVRWINRYEWRTLTDTERCAIGEPPDLSIATITHASWKVFFGRALVMPCASRTILSLQATANPGMMAKSGLNNLMLGR